MASGGSEEIFGEFSINFSDILGWGAYGTVTTGTDANGKTVAAKRIPLEDGGKARKVSDDLDRLKTLDHQNIVKIFEVDRQQKVLWIIMDYCQYGDLKIFFKKRSLNESQKFEMMHQISMGVEYLHNKDIIHRDIKPANILVAQEKPVVVKLTDFDCSKFLDPHYVTSCMSTNVGTPDFKAPEFFKRVKVGDKNRIEYHRSIDIYAAGLTFLAMMQGNKYLVPRIETANDESELFIPIGQLIAERIKDKKNPLEILKSSGSNSASKLFSRLLGKKEKPLSAADARIEQLRELIREMTRVEPTDRINAAQVVQRIQQILEKIPIKLNTKLVMTAGTGVQVFGLRLRAVMQTGHLVFWGKSSWESSDALHIFFKSPEGLEKFREVRRFCEHEDLFFTTLRDEFLAVFCSSCQKIRLCNIITAKVTTAFHNDGLLLTAGGAAAEKGFMYVNCRSGVLKLDTKRIPFTVTMAVDVKLEPSDLNMIHIPAPFNLFVFNKFRESSIEVWGVSCLSGEKRWEYSGKKRWKYSGDSESSLRRSGAKCYSKEHRVLLVGDFGRILVLDPEDGSLIHTVEMGEEFSFILDLHINEETLIVHHKLMLDSENKVSFYVLE